MHEFRVRDQLVFRVSVASGDFDVKDGVVDLSKVSKDDRAAVERELSGLVRFGLLEVAEKGAAQPAADKNQSEAKSSRSES